MAKIQVTVCDVCRKVGGRTAKYRIVRPGAARQFDLCEEHAAPLEELLKRAEKERGTPRRLSEAVVTIEEIEATKKGK